jgi:hypothetical protein
MLNFLMTLVPGILASLIAAIVYNWKVSKLYLRWWRYRKLIGTYNHNKSIIILKHLKADLFQAIAYTDDKVEWISNLQYLNNSAFYGIYDYKPDSGKVDWGEHHLHVLPNGNINVIWINKSSKSEAKTQYTFVKQN